MKTLINKKNLLSSSIALVLSGCMTTGTEDVTKDDYADFDLGPSPLFVETNANDMAGEKSSLDKGAPQPKKEAFESRHFPSLPSITNASFDQLSNDPNFADDTKKLSVSVDEVTVSEFIHHIYGDLLDLDYAISPEVESLRNKVVLRLQTPVSSIELYRLANNLLQENTVSVASKDNILYFQRTQRNDKGGMSVGIGSSPNDVPQASGKITQLVPYTFDSGDNIRRVVGQLSNVSITDMRNQKLLMIEGERSEILRAIQLVNMMDVPSAKGRDIRFINLAHATTGEMSDLLTQVLTEEGINVGSSGDVALVPIARQNSVIVYSSSRQIGVRVEQWARKLDKPEESAKAKFYIYRPKFSKAENIHKALSEFISTGSGPRSTTTTNAESASGASVSIKRESESIIQDSSFKISIDEVQNSLLIQATPQQYAELIDLLDQLDQLPPQVALDVAIAEFDISDNFTAGISKILYDSKESNGESSTISIEPGKGAISFSGVFDSTTIDMSLIAAKSKSRVLSRPYLVVQDGESASISAGKQVPIQVGSNTTDGGNTTTEIQYRSTGVSLSVTPTINADGLVSLEIQQSVSGSEPGPADLNPIITDRSLQTSVLVGNGQTAILGGLIQNNDSNQGNSVPFLSSVPLLGNLFKAKADAFSRSELVIMITPKIMKSTNDLDDYSDSMREVFTLDIGQPFNMDKELKEKSKKVEQQIN